MENNELSSFPDQLFSGNNTLRKIWGMPELSLLSGLHTEGGIPGTDESNSGPLS